MGINKFLKYGLHGKRSQFHISRAVSVYHKKQIIFKTCLCKRSISHHFSLCFPFFPLVHPFASPVPQKLPSKNIYEKWQNCLFCLISVKSNADFISVSWFLALQKQGALEGILGPLSCRSSAHPSERTLTLRMTQPKSKNGICTHSKGRI